ncbi:MAG TPA: outer membrane beta-barrel protein [Prolixibacteraceae bacterium]|nr:outer membrane beta-barrel protein [Prolixibacteraceae bacterium]
MNYTLKSFILGLAFLVSLGVMGQDNYKKGYVITLDNDTLFGKINDAGGFKNSRLCTFKEKKDRKVKEYLPGQIKGYRMYKDKYYVSKAAEEKNGNEYTFMEVLVEGPVSLYHDRKSTEKAFYIQKKDGDLIPLQNEEVQLRYKPDENIAVLYSPTYILHNRIYRDTLKYVFRDSEVIKEWVDNVEYDAKSLKNITKDYIAERHLGEKSITYERDLKMYRPRVGVYGGIQMTDIEILPTKRGVFTSEEPHSIISKTFDTYPVGIFFNFPLPMLNDKLSFQLELMANGIDYDEEFDRTQSLNDTLFKIKTHTIGIPILLKYELLKGFFSPSLGIGKDISFVYDSDVTIDQNTNLMIHPVQKGGWFGEVGVSFKLAPQLSLFANARYHTIKNLIIEKGNQRATYNSIINSKHFIKEYETSYATLLVGLKF